MRDSAGQLKHEKKLDDYVQTGWYVVLVCIMAELMILPHVTSQFYMMYAGSLAYIYSY